MKLSLRHFVVGLVGFAMLSADRVLPSALACPMCKAALEEDPSKPMAFQTSILFMLAMAMGVFGVMTVLLTVINRRETEALRNTDLCPEGA